MRPGLLVLLLLACGAPSRPSQADLDRDGYPDAAELTDEADRERFVTAFVAVALAQYPEPEPSFDPQQRDCAGLVRYAYREALKAHDAAFAARHPGLPRLPEIRAFRYPKVPLLGSRLFRAAPGSFDAASIERDFSEAPEAMRLVLGSAQRVDTPPRAGDLLLFRPPGSGAHVMVVAEGGADPLLVYHTGSPGPGQVRRIRQSVLATHPDPAWHPRAGNPAFAGAFRFKILEGA